MDPILSNIKKTMMQVEDIRSTINSLNKMKNVKELENMKNDMKLIINYNNMLTESISNINELLTNTINNHNNNACKHYYIPDRNSFDPCRTIMICKHCGKNN
jgi:hypothetical protein